MNNRETYEALPHQIQQAVARDWLERKRVLLLGMVAFRQV